MPDYAHAENKATEVLLNIQSPTIPIIFKPIVESLSNLELYSFSKAMGKFGFTLDELIAFCQSEDGCCIYNKSKGQYLIYINDYIGNEGRMRWTLAHELGHYFLDHHRQTNEPLLSRNSLSEAIYVDCEKEANCFARVLLAHPNLISALEISDSSKISNAFNVTADAAQNIVIFISTGASRWGISYLKNTPITEHFSVALNQYCGNSKTNRELPSLTTPVHSIYCAACDTILDNESAIFCPICGGNETKELTDSGGEKMIYPKITIDENSKIIECPQCANTQLEVGEYCPICGLHGVNRCTGNTRDDFGNVYPCETLLSGGARFCHTCGAPSTFLKNQILLAWNDPELFPF